MYYYIYKITCTDEEKINFQHYKALENYRW